MANISSAYGSMTLKGVWTTALIRDLNMIASEVWAKWYYDIQLDPFDADALQDNQAAAFSGSGRWAFCLNLESLGRWTASEVAAKPEFGAVFNELIIEMQKRGLTIEVSYSDEEGGCLELYSQTGILSSDGETLAYKVTSEENYEYNWENYIEVTGDEDALDMLVESLCEELGLEDDANGMIERWAVARTYPHCMAFDELSEEAQAEFTELFTSGDTNVLKNRL